MFLEKELSNIAIGKPCIQSSYSNWSKKYGAHGVLIELEETEKFGFHTNIEDKPFWVIDLLTEYQIELIKIHNRLDKNLIDRTKTISVEVSNNYKDWTSIHKGIIYFGAEKTNNHPLILPLNNLIKARYIKLSLEEKSCFHLYKVEILAKNKILIENEFTSNKQIIEINTEDQINTIILGTSNSLMSAGYTSSLSENNLSIQHNISLGSSHSPMVPFQIDNSILNKKNHILIYDIAVNEQRALNSNLYNLELSKNIFKMLLNWCYKRNILPIILIMPNSNSINNKNKEIENHYINLCTQYSIPYFNGFSFIKMLSKKWNREMDTFFRDPAHLNKLIAQILGFNLSRSIKRLFNRILTPNLVYSSIIENTFEFYSIDLSEFAKKESIIFRETSLIKTTLVKLQDKDTLTFRVKKKSILVGFVINMYHCNADLRITSGKNSIIKRLTSSQFNIEKNLTLVVWSMVIPFNITDEKLTISIENTENLEFENNDHNGNDKRNMDKEIKLEIKSLIFQNNETKRNLISIKNIDLNLTSLIFDSVLQKKE